MGFSCGLPVKDESDVLDAYIACGGNEDKSGCVHRDLLVKIIKGDFGLPIDIEALINKVFHTPPVLAQVLVCPH